MADSPEKLGTLEYDMLVSQEKLEESLKKIDKLLIDADNKWKEILSGSGTIASPKIDVANIDKLTKANKQIVLSNDQIASSIEKLKVQLAENVANYEKLTAEQRDNEKVGGKLLATIQQQKDQLDQYNKILRENITARKQAAQEAINQAKSEESAKRSLEAQRSKAFVKSNLDEEKRITQEIKNQESALRALEAQRSKAFVKGELQKERELTAEIKKQESALRSLEAQRSKAFVSQKNKELREQIALEKQAAQEQKLRFAIESQQTGSVARLRAEIALYTFQLGQIKKITPETTAEIRRLNAAINANKQEIAALQPTLGFWGKLSSAIRTYVTAYLSVQGAMAIGRAVYNQTKELDALSFSMQTVIKSSVELAQTQKFLSDVAINYGGDLLTLSERYVKFRAAAIQANMSAAETQKIYDSVSKAAGTLGLKTDELSGVYLALEQMISKGKVTTEELRRQLGERLPGAFGIMANALGKTIPELDKMLKKGEVLSSDALPKFAAALEKAYGLEAVDKIDTLAAAQGRLSTQFTELIRSMQASDTFKSLINGLASFIGIIRDNIGAISIFAKAILGLTLANSLYRIEVFAVAKATAFWSVVKATNIGWTTKETVAINGLTGASLRAAQAQNAAAASTTKWSLAFKNFGGFIGVVINALIIAITYFAIFRKEADKTAQSIKTFNENLVEQYAKVRALFGSLESAKKGSNEYKDALFEINNQYGKYLPNLITEKSSIDEITQARNLSILGLREEITLKEKRAKLEEEYAKQEEFSKKLTSQVLAIDPNLSAYQKGILLSMIKDMGDAGVNETEVQGSRIQKQLLWFVKQLNVPIDEKQNIFTKLVVNVRNITDEVIAETKRADKAIQDIKNTYQAKEPITPSIFNFDEFKKQIEDAKEEFRKFDTLQELNRTRGLKKGEEGYAEIAEPNYTERFYSYKNFLITKRKEFLSQSAQDIAAREFIDLKLAEIDKKTQGEDNRAARLLENRNEAINKLNAKYLQDQEDFANYEMGIQATRIANMEDGIEKERALNELAYENRIKAINKEKEATLKLLNEAAGIRIGDSREIKSFDATGYSPEIQKLINDAREADYQKRLVAAENFQESNLALERDFQIKINELRRDANDQFLTGIEKEKAAVNEKYDEWIRKAGRSTKLIAEIEKARLIALQEVDISADLDKLDFYREVEYKRNEISASGAANRRKLDKLNFDTYAKYEQERIKLLKSSANIDKQKEGFRAEEKLKQDEILFGLEKEEQLRQDILEAAAQLTDVLSEALGLSDAQAKQLSSVIGSLQNIASGNYISGAVGLLTSVLDKQAALDFTKLEKKLSEPWEEFEKWLAASNRGLQQYIKLRDEAVGVEKYSASTQLIEQQEAKLAEFRTKLDELDIVMKFSGDGWFGKAYNEMESKIKAMEESLGGVFEQEGNLKEWGAAFWKTVSGVFSFDLSQILYNTLGEFDLTKVNELINQGVITDQAVIDAVDQYYELADAIAEAKKQKDELLTATIADTLAQTLSDGFKEGLSSAQDFASTFEDFIRAALDNALKILSEPEFKEWYSDFAAALESDGKITADEISALKSDWDAIVERQRQNREQLYGIAGLQPFKQDTATTGISKAIQGVTEDTARRLEGLINSIRETSVINMGDTKKIVESNAMIQGYAAQSLSELRQVNTNLATQIGIFNEWTASASGTGGKGLKVYIQQ